MSNNLNTVDYTEGHEGFTYFKAFNKLFNYRVQKDLLSWCIYSISLNDKAHDLKHVYGVCLMANELLTYYKDIYDISDRDETLVLHACLLHDIGCRYNRKYHHVIGYGLTFEYISRYCPGDFSEEELLLIAKCVSEHRSSSRKQPKGILSQIVNVADSGRPDIREYIRRALLFRIDKINDTDEMIDAVKTHLYEKFSVPDGYHWVGYPDIGKDYFFVEWEAFNRYMNNKDDLVALIEEVYNTIKIPT